MDELYNIIILNDEQGIKYNFNNLFDKSVRYYDGDVTQIYSETEKQFVLEYVKAIMTKETVEKLDIELFEQLYVILWHYGQANLINELEIISNEIKRIYFEVKNDFENI